MLLERSLAITIPGALKAEATRRAARYDSSTLAADEARRAAEQQAIIERYRKLLVDGPTLTLPGGPGFDYTFDPRSVVALPGVGPIYVNARMTNEWGVLSATEGVLVVREDERIASVRVAAPASPDARGGPGWTLELKPGWTLGPGTRPGDLVARKSR